MSHLLIVDDELSMRTALDAHFRRRGWQTLTATGVSDALSKFRRSPCRLVVTDMRMEDGDGLAVLEGIRQMAPQTAVIFLTAYGTVPEAVRAIQGGACDYLMKPVSFEQLEEAAHRILAQSFDSANSEAGQRNQAELIGESGAVQLLLARARRVAQAEGDILIEAESGTGKELLAKLIHRSSPRRAKPFVAVNCSAFPENLLESELFGHVRGAFTGALNAKPGKFQVAEGGTLLLDEVGEMPLSLQPKLLRVLQEREIDRLGDTRPLPMDVRVIATTNRSLSAMVEAGTFRSDLFYRLNVIPLSIPPLRERRGDILELAKHFLHKYEPKSQRGNYTISHELGIALREYSWPGNVRELENFIRRALALTHSSILSIELFSAPGAEPSPSHAVVRRPGVTLQEMEKSLLEATLQATSGNRTRTAEMMGVSLRTVRNKIREYGLAAKEAV